MKTLNKHFRKLSEAEMTRQQFLQTIGIGILSLVGITSMLRFLLDNSEAKNTKTITQNDNKVNLFYGAGVYGGNS